MTTREFVPRLDRQITRIVKGASPGINPLGNPLPPTSETEIKVWAGRRDFSGRDFSQVVQGGIVTIRDTRYIVRAESGPGLLGAPSSPRMARRWWCRVLSNLGGNTWRFWPEVAGCSHAAVPSAWLWWKRRCVRVA